VYRFHSGKSTLFRALIHLEHLSELSETQLDSVKMIHELREEIRFLIVI
jgi:hypothetical protein